MKYNAFFAIMLLVLFVGCGNPQVKGTVKYEDGTPLTSGGVVFIQGMYTATAAIKPNGTYVLSQITKRDGVKPGLYKVTVQAQVSSNPDDPGARWIDLIDPKFADPETSGLTFEVKRSATYDITVTEPPGGVKMIRTPTPPPPK
jgi:hypothetical protein